MIVLHILIDKTCYQIYPILCILLSFKAFTSECSLSPPSPMRLVLFNVIMVQMLLCGAKVWLDTNSRNALYAMKTQRRINITSFLGYVILIYMNIQTPNKLFENDYKQLSFDSSMCIYKRRDQGPILEQMPKL